MPDNQESPSKELEQKGDLSGKILMKHRIPFHKDFIKCTDYKNDRFVEDIISDLEEVYEQLTATQQALDSAVEALKFYADIDNTCYDVNFDRSYEYWYDGSPDACKIAKAALASIKESYA